MSRPVNMPRSKCRADACQSDDPGPFCRIRAMRCSMKRRRWHWVPDRVSGRRESPRPASGPRTTLLHLASRSQMSTRHADFFTTEVWTWHGLVTFYTVFVMDLLASSPDPRLDAISRRGIHVPARAELCARRRRQPFTGRRPPTRFSTRCDDLVFALNRCMGSGQTFVRNHRSRGLAELQTDCAPYSCFRMTSVKTVGAVGVELIRLTEPEPIPQ
jgi:hypothetical protein